MSTRDSVCNKRFIIIYQQNENNLENFWKLIQCLKITQHYNTVLTVITVYIDGYPAGEITAQAILKEFLDDLCETTS